MTVAHRRVREVVATPPRVVIVVVVVVMTPRAIFSRIGARGAPTGEPLSVFFRLIGESESIGTFSPRTRRARSRFSPFVSPRIDRSIRVENARKKIRSVVHPNPPFMIRRGMSPSPTTVSTDRSIDRPIPKHRPVALSADAKRKGKKTRSNLSIDENTD